jgi:Uma2 family endonuclease
VEKIENEAMFAFMGTAISSLPFQGATTMPMVICDPDIINEFENEREANGFDKYDEVWEGVPLIMSLPNDEHQEIVTDFSAVLRVIHNWKSPPHIRAGVNVSDRIEGWVENYREPDVAAFCEGNPAINCGTHWCGGPDFLVEIISPGDPTREKLPFYESVNVREVLVVDRNPWRLELYQRQNGKLVLVGTSCLDQPNVLTSSVLSLTFRLVNGPARPQIEIVHQASGQQWLV